MEKKLVSKRKYTLSIPRNQTHPHLKAKSYDERMIQGFYYVKGKYKKEADKIILNLIKQWR